MIAYLVCGLFLPTVLGTGLVRWLTRGESGWIESAAAGYLIGMLGVGLTTYLDHALGRYPPTLATWLIGVGLVAVAAGAVYRRRPSLPPSLPTIHVRAPRLGALEWSVIGICLALVAARTVGLGIEVMYRPTFPWDAWATWEYRLKAWYTAGDWVAFRTPAHWLGDPQHAGYAAPGARYPALIAQYQLFLLTRLGRWSEPLAHLPWLLGYLALGGIGYGHLRRLELRPGAAWVGIYLLLSLPFLATHVALAGYRDLWLAIMLLAAAVYTHRWRLQRDHPGWLVLGGLFAVACPLIKLEGAPWVGILLPSLALSFVGRRVRLLALLAVVLVPAGLIAVGGVDWQLAEGVRVALTQERIELPYVGALRLSDTVAVMPVLMSLFAAWNWHLLFYLLAAAVLVRALVRPGDEARFLDCAALLGALAVGFLFFATEAARWASDQTSLNRVLLQWVPVWWLWGAALLTNTSGFGLVRLSRERA